MELLALMKGIEQGDENSFATLCANFKGSVMNAALSRTDNTDDAKLISKAVFREVYTSIHENGPYPGDFQEWLFSLTDKHVRLLWHKRVQHALEQSRLTATNIDPAQNTAQETVAADKSAVIGFADTILASRQYTAEEARELEARADERLFKKQLDDKYEKEVARNSMSTIIALVGLTGLLFWMLIGFLSSLNLIPEIDLGYRWFNETVFWLF